MQLEGYVNNINENYDKNGKLYYTDSFGNVMDDKTSVITDLANKLKAAAFNANRWINETNPNSEAYQQKANILLGLETAPFGLGANATKAVATKLTPYVGRRIGQSIAEGTGSGLVGGAVEGFNRGLIEGENPFKTMATDALTYAGLGGLGGYGFGKIGQQFAKRGLVGNPEAQLNYFDDYIDGLNNNFVNIGEARALKNGNYGTGNEDIAYLFAGENAHNLDINALTEAERMMQYENAKNKDVWDKTGFFKGVDGKWRFEIPSGKLKDDIDWIETWNINNKPLQYAKLSDVYDNPEFYNAYPYSKYMDVDILDLGENAGTFNELGKEILLDKAYNYRKANPETIAKLEEIKQNPIYKKAHDYRSDKPFEDIVKDYKEYKNSDIRKQEDALMENLSMDGWNENALKSLEHELQHYIQSVENFARGGNPKSAGSIKNYSNLAGETEARLTEARSGLSKEELKNFAPFIKGKYGYDVAPTKQILKNDYGVYGKGTTYNKVIENYTNETKRIQLAEENLAKDIEAHLNGKMSANSMINFGKPSKILKDFGVPDLDMYMAPKKYDMSTNRKAIKGEIHQVPDEVMKKIPSLLQKPRMIMKAPKPEFNNSRYVIQINKNDKNGNPIVVILDYNSQKRKINIIPSVYGKENFNKYVLDNWANVIYKK